MKLVDMSVAAFLDELGSKSPAPGGGSVAALTGANGAALVCMVGALTTKKKKFKSLDEKTQSHYQVLLDYFLQAKTSFTRYIDQDTEAFNEVMAAFKLPKNNDEEIEQRKEAIELATIGCIKTPMEVGMLAFECLKRMEAIIKDANRNTTSDQGVAVLAFYTAFQGAMMNVQINLPGLSKKDLVKKYQQVMQELTQEVNRLKDQLLSFIEDLLQ